MVGVKQFAKAGQSYATDTNQSLNTSTKNGIRKLMDKVQSMREAERGNAQSATQQMKISPQFSLQ